MNASPTLLHRSRGAIGAVALVLITALAGCASPSHRAPVEDRNPATRPVPAALPPVAAVPPASMPAIEPTGKVPPGIENLGKPGYYSVKPGDTLIRVGLENGQNWRDIARWNNLDNPNAIEIGQVLRVVPPAAEVPAVATAKPIASAAKPEVRPLEPKPVVREGDDDINWMWPAAGPVIAGFDDVKSKGLSIAGNAGDPVVAAADGRVVYAGAGLRGYGNLVIVKHNATYLTAYAHNQSLLVKEDQVVLRGQKIAEMGSSDSDRVLLHFEIRRQGKPIDPARLLPPR